MTSLKYPLVAANGPRFAADIVSVVREGARIRLDYSVRSLAVVDRLIQGIRSEAPPVEAVTETLLGFGAYAGEVLVRHADASWVDFDETQREWFGHPFGVRTPDGRAWNPLGRAVRCFENGIDDSVQLLYVAVVVADPRDI
ncbi:hypothetical protein AQ490_03955 [Wenjunlia vitaminophila]|uniref:Uncharacterized protein n=1 Tax=Wenjunlia vitaminophila TaxID=76728 RepID=A0A0T6LRB0_WENVI|nr:hypothetical protein AQ490_03955 [Wenjunlia vitaminophila]